MSCNCKFNFYFKLQIFFIALNFVVGVANQRAMETILHRLQAGYQDPSQRSQTHAQQPESQDLSEALNSANNEKLNKELQRIELLKKTVLEKLKLSAPPNMTKTKKLPLDSPVVRALFKEYGIDQSRIIDNDDDDEIKSQKLISTARPPPFNASTSKDNWFYFDFAPEEREYFRVKSANIWFYVRNSSAARSSATIRLDVVRSYLNETDGETSYKSLRHSIKHLNLSDSKQTNTWKHFPVTNIVSSWLTNPSSNFGMKLYSKQIKDLVANGANIDEAGYKPFLEIQLVSDHHRRKRDTQRQCEESADGRRSCCVDDLQINFHELGWDWIIYPTSYNGKICQGQCIAETTEVIHSQLAHQAQQDQQVMSRSAQISRAIQPRSCCVPTKYQSLSLLYYDNQGNLVYSEVPDMEIKKCGCL